MGRYTWSDCEGKARRPADGSDDEKARPLEEIEPPDLYSNITLHENALGENVWDTYEKIELIDESGTGELWMVRKQNHERAAGGRDDHDGAIVAEEPRFVVKCIDKNFLFGLFSKELRNEIENLRKVDHPNVVRIYETFETRDSLFLVMEYCSGGDLFTRMPYTESQSAHILRQILSAVAHCHKQKIIHRDLKMENILWESNDRDASVKVIDFGYAQSYRRSRGDYTMKIDIGTTYTMSPQVIEGAYTEKCDLWSVGVIAYILLSGGVRPFDGDHDKDIRDKIKLVRYSMGGSQWESISQEAKAFVTSLLEYRPDRRVTAEEALESQWLKSRASLVEPDPGSQIMNTVQDALVHLVKEPKLKRLAMMVIAHSTPAQKLQELRLAFSELDKTHDGTIIFEEFKDALRDQNLSDEELRKIFSELDQSNTGAIHYTDFLSATLEKVEGVEEELVEEAFQKLDVDNYGDIHRESLSRILETSGVSHHESHMNSTEILKEAGATTDEKISYDTFSSLFEDKNHGC